MALLKIPANKKLTREDVRANVGVIVDELGARKAELARAKIAVDGLVNMLKDISPTAEVLIEEERNVTYAGGLFEAVVYAQNKPTTDWEAVCKAAKVKERIIQKYTTSNKVLACRVQARKMPT